MYFSAIRLLFILSLTSVISGASVAERDYSPSHHSNQYEVSKDWNNREHPGWRNDQDEYDSRRENNDYRRHSDYHNGNDKDYEKHYDIEHDDYERGGNRYEDRHDRYRNGSHHNKEDWDYDDEDSRNGRDHYIDDNIPSGGEISEGTGSSSSGSPTGGDGDAPNGQENIDPAAGNGTGEAAGNKETIKPGGSPAGDRTNIHEGNECHGNLLDGRIGILDIKANVCLGLDLTGNIINNDQGTSSPEVPSGITEGIPSGTPGGKSNGLPGGSGGDTISNGPNTPKLPGAPAGDAENLQNGVPSSSSTNSGRCEDIAVKVRQLLGINADAVVCLDGLIRVDTRDHPNTGLLPGVLNSGDDGKHRREICETIKAHANILGITVDAVICLPEIVIRM